MKIWHHVLLIGLVWEGEVGEEGKTMLVSDGPDNHGPRSQSTSMLDLRWPSKHNSGILLSRNENVAKLCLYFDVDPSDWGEDE